MPQAVSAIPQYRSTMPAYPTKPSYVCPIQPSPFCLRRPFTSTFPRVCSTHCSSPSACNKVKVASVKLSHLQCLHHHSPQRDPPSPTTTTTTTTTAAAAVVEAIPFRSTTDGLSEVTKWSGNDNDDDDDSNERFAVTSRQRLMTWQLAVSWPTTFRCRRRCRCHWPTTTTTTTTTSNSTQLNRLQQPWRVQRVACMCRWRRVCCVRGLS